MTTIHWRNRMYSMEPHGSVMPYEPEWLDCFRLLEVADGQTYLECVHCGLIRPAHPIEHAMAHGYPPTD
jgi:hypothetical protein